MRTNLRTNLRTTFASLTAVALAATTLTACSSSSAEEDTTGPLSVLATANPHREILEWVDEQHDEFALDVTITGGGPETNSGVADGSADLNFFQHEPYLVTWEAETGQDLETYAKVHVEPIAAYSAKYSSFDELPDGAKVVVPSNPSNYARSLLLLQEAGLIKLGREVDPETVATLTDADITENPKNLKIEGVEGEIIAHSYNDRTVDVAVINSNFALEAGLDPLKDGIYTESPVDNPYENILVGLPDRGDDPRIKALAEALESKETADWIREKYGQAVLPVNQD